MTAARRRRPVLYGPTGRPMAGNLYPTTTTHPHLYRAKGVLQRSIRANVNSRDRKELCDYSQQLFSRMPNLAAAIMDKAGWAFLDGWDPIYTGGNQGWGSEATTFLRELFFPRADRHGRWDWQTLLFLSSVAWDRDGDDLMLLTEDATGFPAVEIIPGTRIANGNASQDNLVHDGPYRGNAIVDGIIYSANLTPIAARVLGERSDGTTSADDWADFSIGWAGQGDLAYHPEWAGQGRGIPLVGRAVLDWLDLEDVDQFLKRGIKRAASVGLLHKNREGEAALGNEVVTTEEEADTQGTTHEISYEEIEGGEMYYLRSLDKENIEGLKFETPHPNVEAFLQRIERRAIKAIGWSYELIYLGESGRAATRLVCDLGNTTIWKAQKLGLRRTWRAVRYALAVAQKRGLISKNPDDRDAYFAWDFCLPKELSVDQGNDEQADRENLKIGSTNLAIVAGRKGRHWQDVRRQRKVEILAAAEDAAEIEKATKGKIKFDRALDMIEQRGPNPGAAPGTPPPAKPGAAPPGSPPPAKPGDQPEDPNDD